MRSSPRPQERSPAPRDQRRPAGEQAQPNSGKLDSPAPALHARRWRTADRRRVVLPRRCGDRLRRARGQGAVLPRVAVHARGRGRSRGLLRADARADRAVHADAGVHLRLQAPPRWGSPSPLSLSDWVRIVSHGPARRHPQTPGRSARSSELLRAAQFPLTAVILPDGGFDDTGEKSGLSTVRPLGLAESGVPQ